MNVKLLHRFTAHAAGMYGMELHNEGKALYCGGSERVLSSWDLEKNEVLPFQASLPHNIYSIQVLDPETLIAAGTFTGHVHILDTVKKKEIKSLSLHQGAVFDLALIRNRSLLISAGGDGQLGITDSRSLEPQKIYPLCQEKVRCIGIGAEEDQIAVASGDGYIRIFDTGTMTLKKEFKAHELSANCVRWDPNSRQLVTGGRDAHLRVWDSDSLRLIREIPAHNFAIYSIAFHPEGHLMATASRDKTIRIWETAGWRPLFTIDQASCSGHRSSVNRLLWSSYKNTLISCSDDRTVITWNVEL